MSKWVTYEWTVELINQSDDIVDSLLFETLAEAKACINAMVFDGSEKEGEPVRFDWGLTRFDAYEGAREYAYVRGGKLEDEFDTGRAVPKKYLKLDV